ncbi:MAG TPA: hypothetical protein VF441_02750 [Acidimicrobiia bacterium]
MTTLSVGDEDAYIEQTRFRRVNTGASWVVLVEALVSGVRNEPHVECGG